MMLWALERVERFFVPARWGLKYCLEHVSLGSRFQ
jgi:hypothetical protein